MCDFVSLCFFLVIFFFLVLFFYFRKHSKITAGQKAASSFHLASIQLLNPRLYHPGRCTFCVLPILFILLQCRLLQSVVTITSTSSTTSIAFLLAAISSELCFGALERKTTVTGRCTRPPSSSPTRSYFERATLRFLYAGQLLLPLAGAAATSQASMHGWLQRGCCKQFNIMFAMVSWLYEYTRVAFYVFGLG